MPLSPSQLKRYWLELHAVEAASPSPLAGEGRGEGSFRADFHARNGLPASTKNFSKTHFDAFLAACAAITQPANLQPQLRAFDQPKTRLLTKINKHQAAMLHALDIADPHAYIAEICASKFRGRKPADLSAEKTLRARASSPSPLVGEGRGEGFSELDMLLWSVARAISELRQTRGWTEHELLWQAGLGATCRCADCSRQRSFSRRQQNDRRKVGTVAPRDPLPVHEPVASNPF